MTPELIEDLVHAARERGKSASSELRVGHEFAIAEAVRRSAAYEAVKLRWPYDDLDEVLRRSGLFANSAEGVEVEPAKLETFLKQFAGQPRSTFGAIEVLGADFSGPPIVLGEGFRLQRFTQAEVEQWNPPLRREQLDACATSHYTFVVSDTVLSLAPRPSFVVLSEPPKLRPDVFWADGWWKPFLVLNLFHPTSVLAGVRLNVSPGWSIQRQGEFEGEYFERTNPETGEIHGEYWETFVHEPDFDERRSELGDFASAVFKVLGAMACSAEAEPFRVAARAYLRATARIGAIRSPRR